MPGLRAYVSTAGKLQPEERAALRAAGRAARHRLLRHHGRRAGRTDIGR